MQTPLPESIARPSRIQLRAFAERLSSLHPADLGHILQSMAEFGYQFYPVIDLAQDEPIQFIDPLHEATDLAHTLAVVFKDVYHHPLSSCPPQCEVSVHLFMADVYRVFDLANDYLLSECNDERRSEADLVLAQLRRVMRVLGTPSPAVSQKPRRTQHLASPLSIFAAICFAGLVWDLIADHFPLWQLMAALALVAAFGALVFRLGAESSRWSIDASTGLNR